MSELTTPIRIDIPGVGSIESADLYLKSEADKVIAELKEGAKSLILDNYLQDKELRRHKYKRCLAMARWCWYWANYWEACIPSDCSMFILKARYYRKWHKRWLELAEKFK